MLAGILAAGVLVAVTVAVHAAGVTVLLKALRRWNTIPAIAATIGLSAGGWSRFRIMRLWLLMAVVCGVASLAGFVLLENVSNPTQAFINMFAGGAILVMLADTMIPEAFEHGGKLAGLINVMGFALAAYFSTIS